MKTPKIMMYALLMSLTSAYSQCTNCLLQMYKGASQVIISMNGTATNSAYIIINPGSAATTSQDNVYSDDNGGAGNGVSNNASNKNQIVNINQNGFNYLQWNTTTATGPFVFPFGKGTSSTYIPYTFNVNSGSNASTQIAIGTYQPSSTDNTPLPQAPDVVAHVSSQYGGDPVLDVIDRWYSVRVMAGAAPNADLTFKYDGAESPTTSTIGAQRWDISLSPIDYDPPLGAATAVNSGVGALSVFGQTQYTSIWVLSRSAVPLPVDLIAFAAKCNNGKNTIKWVTASETNNGLFTLERSIDGSEFVSVVAIHGSGTTSQVKTYTYTDIFSPKGLCYYRLKQMDYDGKSTYSKVISSNCELEIKDKQAMSIYPSPMINGQSVIVEINGYESEQEVTINLVDNLGRVIAHKIIVTDSQGGGFDELVPPNSLAAGIYTVVSSSSDKTLKQRLVVNR